MADIRGISVDGLEIDDSSPELSLETGLRDDQRVVLTPESRLYGFALRAWCDQDTWPLEELKSFMRDLEALWPLADSNGRPRTRNRRQPINDERALAAGMMLARGATREEAARRLGVQVSSFDRKVGWSRAEQIATARGPHPGHHTPHGSGGVRWTRTAGLLAEWQPGAVGVQYVPVGETPSDEQKVSWYARTTVLPRVWTGSEQPSPAGLRVLPTPPLSKSARALRDRVRDAA